MKEINHTLDKIKYSVSLALFILSTFFYTYLWHALRIMDDGLRSGQLRGYVSIRSINSGFVSWYTGGPLFDPYSYAIQNLIFPAFMVILFLLSLTEILFLTSDVKSYELSTVQI